MAKKNNNSGAFLIFVAIAGIILGVILIASPEKTSAPTQDTSSQSTVGTDEKLIYRDDAPYIGKKDAKVKVVIFSDYLCPGCKNINTTLKEIADKYGDKIVVYHRTYLIHNAAEPMSRAAEAASLQGKFKEANDLIFNNYQNADEKGLAKIADDLGLNKSKFTQDMSSEKIKNNVAKDSEDAVSLGLQGTPSIFVNGTYLEDLSQLSSTIEADLNK